MNILAKSVVAGAAALALAFPLAVGAQERAEPSKGEVKLAKLLEGRIAGEPERCIRTFPSRSLTIIDGTAIVSDQGDTVWVNYTRHPDGLDDNDALLIRKFGSVSQLCQLDTVTTFDRFNGFYTGNVFLTDFIPYRKVEDAG